MEKVRQRLGAVLPIDAEVAISHCLCDQTIVSCFYRKLQNGRVTIMRKVSIRVAKPGQRLARDITTDMGHVLLRAGRELNAPLIDKLKMKGVDTVFIEDRRTEGIRPVETLEPEARLDAIQRIRRSMASISKDSSIQARAVTPSLGETFRNIFRALLTSLSVREAMLINLTDLYVKDDYLFNQSINVAVLSIIMGISKG